MEAAAEVDCYAHEVAPPARLAGSDGFGRVRVLPEEAGDPPLERFRSLIGQRRDVAGAVDLLTVADFCSDVRQRSCFSSEELSKQLPCSCPNGPSCPPKTEQVQVHRKAGKIARSSSGCSKRARIMQSEDATSLAEVDVKDVSEKLGSFQTKCDSHEKSHLAKQKNSFSSKRGDRRNFKACMKSKFDCFSMKGGLLGCSSATGGNNFSGLYGLKTELQDITKLVDDISLNDVLEGTYVCPTLRTDKGKKAANGTEDIIDSVRRACNIFQLSKAVKSENLVDNDSCSNEKIVTCSSSHSVLANGDPSSTASCSSDQDSCLMKPESPINLLDFPFEQPLMTLERLALTPPKDFESLLLDAAKPATPARNALDPRLAKQLCREASLPPFSWSHAFNGHSKSNSDAVKLLTSRNSCQGRWIRLGNFTSSPLTPSDGFVELDSLTYDESLVPVRGPKLPVVENKMSDSKPVPPYEQSLSVVAGLAASSISSKVFLESGGGMKCRKKVECCPRIFAAAQTLCDIATNASTVDQDGIIRWPKKLSTKAMKARKSKSDEKPEEVSARPTSFMVSDYTARIGVEHKVFSKRPRLLSQSNSIRGGSLSWSAPKSSRSSPNKSVKDLITGSRNSATYMVKQSCMMPPPPAKVLSRHCDGQKKVRKFMQMDWKRE